MSTQLLEINYVASHANLHQSWISKVTDNLIAGSWNPARVMSALGRIGYKPDAAILDVVDNSISAGATKVSISLNLEPFDQGGSYQRSRVAVVRVIDNGCGMDTEGLANAISLGSSEAWYQEGTLSKFGLGLKSASASLGRRLTIVTRDSTGECHRLVLDHDLVAKRGEYVYSLDPPSADEVEILDLVASGGSGTLVEISKLHDHLPAPVDIQNDLRRKAGIVYFYSLSVLGNGDGIVLEMDRDAIEPIDPLHEGKIADHDPNLDESSWDGLTTKYIETRKPFQLSPDGSIVAYVTMTQLPHPPSWARAMDSSKAECRRRFQIEAGNYGFYIYRNGRLIGWAESLGMVPNEQELYSFRGRIEIDSTADDVLNLDVTKSRIHLSEIAETQLKPLVSEGMKKSRSAWRRAGLELQRVLDISPHEQTNALLDEVARIEEKEDELDDSVESKEEQYRRRSRRDESSRSRAATPDESERIRQRNERVQYVETLDNNQLWERGHDPEHGLFVRVNRSHRMFVNMIHPHMEDAELVRSFDIFFYGLAKGEHDFLYRGELDLSVAEEAMESYRERVSSVLSETIRRMTAGLT